MLITVGLLAAVVLLLLVHAELPSPRTLYYFFKLPGPSDLPIVGSALSLIRCRRDGHFELIAGYLKNWPGYCAVYLFGHCLLLVDDPDIIKMVLSNPANADRGMFFELVKEATGNGIVTYYDKGWPERRKLLTPIYQTELTEGLVDSFVRTSKELVEELAQVADGIVDITDVGNKFIISAIIERTGIKMSKKRIDEFFKVFDDAGKLILKRVTKVWMANNYLFRLCVFDWWNWRKIKILLNQTVSQFQKETVIHSMEMNGKPKFKGYKDKTFVESIIERVVRLPGGLSQTDQRDEIKTFIVTATDTLSSSLCSSLFSLGHNLDVQERVYEEVREVLGDKEELTAGDLGNLEYLGAFIKEVFRLYPPVPFLPRKLGQDIVLDDGTVIPRGVTIGICLYQLHRKEEHFNRPEEFKPERFLEEVPRHSHGYIPFSTGPRNCMGQKVALIALKIFIIHIVRKFKILPVTRAEDVKYAPDLVLRPNKRLVCQFVSR